MRVPRSGIFSAALLAFLLQPAIVPAQAPTSGGEPEISAALMRAIEALALETLSFGETVRPLIDRSGFDQAQLVDRLDFDDAQIMRFVTEEIGYEVYAGVLRGAHGTLLARAGNALDQSLLLATLLNEAGFEAVIRAGTLSGEDARRLLQQLGRDTPQPVVFRDQAAADRAAETLLARFAAVQAVEAREGRELRDFTMDDVRAGIERDRDDLLAALAAADIRLGEAPGEAGSIALREAQDYHWVEYRPGPARPWVPVHAAFGGAPEPEVEVAATHAGQIPEELTHRLRLELLVDRRAGAESDTVPLMASMEFPSANVAGRSLSLLLLPDTVLRAEPLEDDAALAETRFLIPLINAGVPAGALALAPNGMTVSPDLIMLSESGVFETVAGRFESAAEALRGLGRAKDEVVEPLLAIAAVRLRVTLIRPGGGERMVERVLYRAPGEAVLAEDAGDTERRAALVAELARAHALGFVPGVLSPAYVLEETFAELATQAPRIRAWSDPALDDCDTLECLPRPELERGPVGAGIALEVSRFDRELPVEAGALVYRDAPTVVRASAPLFPNASPVPGVFDIMNNDRRAFRLTEGGPVPAPDLVLLAGVAETHLERLLPGALRGVGSTIERRGADGGTAPSLRAWRVLPPLPAGAAVEAGMMTQALSSGGVLVTAGPAPARGDTLLGWWEVDPVTGRTLGMARYGGPSASEYVPYHLAIAIVAGVVLGGHVVASIIICADPDARPTRDLPTPSGTRHQKASWLSCSFCLATSATYTVVTTGGDLGATEDAMKWCITKRDGWE